MSKKKAELEQLQQRVNDLEAQLKRAIADYRNLESRISQGRSELTNFVGAQLLKKLLPVLDHLEQALSGISEEERQSGPALSERSESNGWAKGVELAVKEFKQVLVQEGLDEIATEGQFDPSLHEAVDTTEGEDNTILKVVRKGFRLNGKVLRPAQVVVGRQNPPTDEDVENLPGGETQSDVHSPLEEDKKEEN